MSDYPSWKTSTLAQLAVLSMMFYALFLALISGGVMFAHVGLDVAEKLMGWATVLLTMFGSSYLTARKTGQNGPPTSPPAAGPP